MLVGTRNWYVNSDLISHFLAMNYTSKRWGNESPSTSIIIFLLITGSLGCLSSGIFSTLFLSFMLSGDIVMQ